MEAGRLLSLYTGSVVLLLSMVFRNTVENSSKCHLVIRKGYTTKARHEHCLPKTLFAPVIVLSYVSEGSMLGKYTLF